MAGWHRKIRGAGNESQEYALRVLRHAWLLENAPPSFGTTDLCYVIARLANVQADDYQRLLEYKLPKVELESLGYSLDVTAELVRKLMAQGLDVPLSPLMMKYTKDWISRASKVAPGLVPSMKK